VAGKLVELLAFGRKFVHRRVVVEVVGEPGVGSAVELRDPGVDDADDEVAGRGAVGCVRLVDRDGLVRGAAYASAHDSGSLRRCVSKSDVVAGLPDTSPRRCEKS